jgi:hypothetical protein
MELLSHCRRMSASFNPPEWLVYHEVGHALMCFAQRLGIKNINVDMAYLRGRVNYATGAYGEVEYMCAIAGPVAQQVFVPASIHDPRLNGMLFDLGKAGDFHHWSNMECAVSEFRNFWNSDLKSYYTYILTPPTTCAERVPPLANAELRTREFFRISGSINAAHVLATRLRDERGIDGPDAEEIISPFFSPEMFFDVTH